MTTALFIGLDGKVVAAEPWVPAKTFKRHERQRMNGSDVVKERTRNFVLKRFLYSEEQWKAQDFDEPEVAVYEETTEDAS